MNVNPNVKYDMRRNELTIECRAKTMMIKNRCNINRMLRWKSTRKTWNKTKESGSFQRAEAKNKMWQAKQIFYDFIFFIFFQAAKTMNHLANESHYVFSHYSMLFFFVISFHIFSASLRRIRMWTKSSHSANFTLLEKLKWKINTRTEITTDRTARHYCAIVEACQKIQSDSEEENIKTDRQNINYQWK